MREHPFREYRSVAAYVYTAIIQLKSRDEIIQTLMEGGYTKQQAMVFYKNYLARFYAYRQRLIEKQESSSLSS